LRVHQKHRDQLDIADRQSEIEANRINRFLGLGRAHQTNPIGLPSPQDAPRTPVDLSENTPNYVKN
jgi:hypothetical protein